MAGSITQTASGAVIFAGDATEIYRLVVVRQGLKACKIGMRVNRGYTPTACLKAAGKATGKVYKRGEYDAAIADLTVVIDAARSALEPENSTGGA